MNEHWFNTGHLLHSVSLETAMNLNLSDKTRKTLTSKGIKRYHYYRGLDEEAFAQSVLIFPCK